MNLETLYDAIEVVHADPCCSDPQRTTELRLYPLLLAEAQGAVPSGAEGFLRVAGLAYALMPAPLRIDPQTLAEAGRAFARALAPDARLAATDLEAIAACLGSLEGASRVLHLASPAAYPFWTEAVERFRLRAPPSTYHMHQARHYLHFIAEVAELERHELFLTFHHDYCTAYQARLQRLKIPAYPLTQPRVIESAASELAALTR